MEIEENPDDYHCDLVNNCQRHECSTKCQRRNKITKKIGCRFSFPKKHSEETSVVVLPYSKNKENNDIYYKVEIISRRNDEALNEFFRPFLDHWQV